MASYLFSFLFLTFFVFVGASDYSITPSTDPSSSQLMNQRFQRSALISNRGFYSLHGGYKHRARNVHLVMTVKLLKRSSQRYQNCIRCPENKTVIAKRDTKCSSFTLPPITSCSSIKGKPGRPLHFYLYGKRQVRMQFLPEGSHRITLNIKNSTHFIRTCSFQYNIKVNRCGYLPKILNGNTICNHGRLWGSRCQFNCLEGFTLKGFPSILCNGDERIVNWTRPPPRCIAADNCVLPTLSSQANLNCAVTSLDGYSVPSGAVCEYHCNQGFQLTYASVAEGRLFSLYPTIQCMKGNWNVSLSITCEALPCKRPDDPLNGFIKCDNDFENDVQNYLRRGTVCEILCKDGYIISKNFEIYSTFYCIGPNWNDSISTQCRKAVPPVPKTNMCIDQTLFTHNFSTIIPKAEFSTHSGANADVSCTLNGIYKIGSYVNRCTATDPEEGTTADCKYNVEIKIAGCSEPMMSSLLTAKCSNIFNSNSTYLPGTICEYFCARGFTIPTSKLDYKFIYCQENLIWNSTVMPECKRASLPVLIPGTCDDINILTEVPQNEIIKTPKFLGEVIVSCNMSSLTHYGLFINWCIATDPELRTNYSCSFAVSVEETKCKDLLPPVNGEVNCQIDDLKVNCKLSCFQGFIITSEHEYLQRENISCDLHDGLWNFQKQYNLQTLPDCIGQESTYLQTELFFNISFNSCEESSVENIIDIVKNGLINRNHIICSQINCTDFTFDCHILNNKSVVLEIIWNVMAKYALGYEDLYYDENEIDAEAQLTRIQEEAHRIITSDSQFHKELISYDATILDGYQQGKIIIACAKKGYILDEDNLQCLQCPTGSFYKNKQCMLCPANKYQDETGKMNCKNCPDNTFSLHGSRFKFQCKDQTNENSMELLNDAEYNDYCNPNPCQNGGICVQTDDDAICMCDRYFDGIFCEQIVDCPSGYCLNGGSCNLKLYEFTCVCLPAYTGRRCDSSVLINGKSAQTGENFL